MRMLDWRRVVLCAVGAMIVVAAAGCGGGGKSSATATTAPQSATTAVAAPTSGTQAQASPKAALKDPCGYATVAEVQAATGKTVTGAPNKVNDFSCRYQTSDGGVINTLVSYPVESARFADAVAANSGSGTPQKIAGLGDQAFATFYGVQVLKGTTSISADVSPDDTQIGGTASTALARLLLSRIGP